MRVATFLLVLSLAACALQVQVSALTNSEFFEMAKENAEDLETVDDGSLGDDEDVIIELPGNANDELDTVYLLSQVIPATESHDADMFDEADIEDEDEGDADPRSIEQEPDIRDLLNKLDEVEKVAAEKVRPLALPKAYSPKRLGWWSIVRGAVRGIVRMWRRDLGGQKKFNYKSLSSLNLPRHLGTKCTQKALVLHLTKSKTVRITACVKATYLPAKEGLLLSFIYNGRNLFNDTMSLKSHQPLCRKLPGLKYQLDACIDAYNINKKTNGMCLRVTFSKDKKVQDSRYAMPLGCIRIPTESRQEKVKVTRLLDNLQESLDTKDNVRYEDISPSDLWTIYQQLRADNSGESDIM